MNREDVLAIILGYFWQWASNKTENPWNLVETYPLRYNSDFCHVKGCRLSGVKCIKLVPENRVSKPLCNKYAVDKSNEYTKPGMIHLYYERAIPFEFTSIFDVFIWLPNECPWWGGWVPRVSVDLPGKAPYESQVDNEGDAKQIWNSPKTSP